jgi:hypothetical protein
MKKLDPRVERLLLLILEAQRHKSVSVGNEKRRKHNEDGG